MVSIKLEPEDFDTSTFDTSFVDNDTSCSEIPFSASNDEVMDGPVKLEPGDSSISDDVDRPRKKRRVNQVDEVDDEIWEEESEESKIMKLKKLFKPKGKKQIADMTLESKVLLKRLEPIGLEPYEIDLPRAEVNHMVRRDFMSTVYGGSMQATCPDIAQEKLEQHGMNDFMYLKLDYHPFAPQTPGGCGLFFSTQEEVPGDLGLKRVFTRDLRKPHWQYMGQYDVKTAASLSLNEWLDQSVKVRSTWAKNIQKNNWGNVCARVQARKVVGNEHEPTSEDVEAILHDKSWGQITVEEVREAFDVGKERIAVWTMKCVGYDRAFQLELCEKSPPEDAETQTRDVKEETKDGILKGVKQESPTRAPSKGKKRKLDTRMKDEDGEDLDSEDEVLRKIRSRGTRSRPIRVN